MRRPRPAPPSRAAVRPVRLVGAAALLALAACGRDRSSHDGAASVAASMPARAPLTDAAAPVSMKGAAPAAEGLSAPGPAPAPPAQGSAPPMPGAEALATPMLVRTGSAALQVDSLGAGIARVRELAARVGALVADTRVSAGEERPRTATLQLRVPSDRFDEAVSGLSPLGRLETVNVQVEDVGEEYVDVSARVANARRLEARLVELLATRTGRLADVLTVERELARVREEIERYEGRLRYLRTRASYSTLAITVHEPLPLASPPGQHPIADAVRQAWRNFVGVIAALIASLGVLVPVAAIAGAGWWGWKRSRAREYHVRNA